MSETRKLLNKRLRKNRIRSRIQGTAERPRLTVTISNKNVSAQLVDDDAAKTLASVTTVGNSSAKGSLSELASTAGAEIAKKAKKVKVSKVVFDRNGRIYAKRLHAFAEAARKEGLEF